ALLYGADFNLWAIFCRRQTTIAVRWPLQVPRLGRRVEPVVVAAVREAHGHVRELLVADVVERRDVDRDEVAADLLDVAGAERPHAAVLAEQVMTALRRELVVGERVLTREQPEVGGLDDGVPRARPAADRAVALARARREIEVDLE